MNLFEPNIDDFSFVLSEIGKDIKINGNSARALITSLNFNDNYYVDDKYITTLNELYTGDEIEFEGDKWLVLSVREGENVKYKGIMRKCNYNILMIFAKDDVREFPSIIESRSFSVDTGEKIDLIEGKILVTMQDNEDTADIEIDDRFIKMGFAWIITGLDRSQKGLLRIYADMDTFNSSDHKEYEIANYYDYYDEDSGDDGDLW